jgi:hypothetical protein
VCWNRHGGSMHLGDFVVHYPGRPAHENANLRLFRGNPIVGFPSGARQDSEKQLHTELAAHLGVDALRVRGVQVQIRFFLILRAMWEWVSVEITVGTRPEFLHYGGVDTLIVDFDIRPVVVMEGDREVYISRKGLVTSLWVIMARKRDLL